MRTASFSVALAALAQLSAAVPTPEAASPAPAPGAPTSEKRAITHLYICDSSNFRGRCQNLEAERNRCYTLYNNWSDTVSSLGPDSGTTCTIWENKDCQGRYVGGIVYPGIKNLDDTPYKFNDKASSYKCS